MKLELVTHCWRYSRALIYQLSSLVLHPPQSVNVLATVFAAREDSNTVQVVEYFLDLPKPPSVQIRAWWLPTNQVTRRLTGRNLAALASGADWVWFADSDYVFRGRCLDQLGEICGQVTSPLLFPQEVQVNITHALGDQLLRRALGEPQLLDIEPELFTAMRMPVAIGGVQIARGDTVRQLGYCKDSRWQGWPSDVWVKTREDVWFRRNLGTQGTPINLPDVFRIRHSVCGGDVTNGGSNIATEFSTNPG